MLGVVGAGLFAPCGAWGQEQLWYGRVSLEKSVVTREDVDYDLAATEPGVAFSAHLIYERQNTPVTGFRAETAYLFAARSGFTAGPRLGFSYGRMAEALTDEVTTEHNTYTTSGHADWISGGVGFEAQIHGNFVVAQEMGLAGLRDHGHFTGGGLEGRFSGWAHSSPYFRLMAGGRLPLRGRTAIGLIGGGELFFCKDDIIPMTLRGVLQLFVDSAVRLRRDQ